MNTFLVVLLIVKLIEVARHESRSASAEALAAAGVTGLLFGLHPLHVESVAWVSERKDLLCAMFYLLSVIMYVKYVCRGGPLWTPKEGQPHRVASIQNDPRIRRDAPARRRVHRGEEETGKAGITTPYPPSDLSSSANSGRVRGRGGGEAGRYILALCFFIFALMSKPMAVSLPLVLLILDWYPFRRIDFSRSSWASSRKRLLSFC